MKSATLSVVLLSSLLASLDGRGTARVEVLRPVSGIAPHLVGAFYEPVGFQQIDSGQYFVFDRRAHTVYGIDRESTTSRKVVEIGHEQGRIIQPSAFDAAPSGVFVVADAPGGRERLQVFAATGTLLGGFTLPGRAAARVTLGNLVLNGIGSLQFTGQSIVMSQPETGSLITEYSLSGTPVRSMGLLRMTGHEQDRDVHLALNSGFPLVNPRGGYYFVFQTGTPLLRKYDRNGTLLFERHIEGREIDELVRSQPTEWPKRGKGNDGELPVVAPTVRAASVDPNGNLWIAMAVPYTYVYDADGEKTRVVQFRAAGVIAPTSLFFAPSGHLLVTPGCYEFATDPQPPPAQARLESSHRQTSDKLRHADGRGFISAPPAKRDYDRLTAPECAIRFWGRATILSNTFPTQSAGMIHPPGCAPQSDRFDLALAVVSLIATILLLAEPSPAIGEPQLEIRQNTVIANGLTAVAGLAVGHYTLAERPTGCTVVLAEAGAVAGVDVRGSAPGTRETDVLSPVNSVDEVQAIVFAGGSVFGLDAASGVVKYLEERGLGFPTRAGKIPIVPAAILFDLDLGDGSKVRPNAECGYQAAANATVGPVTEGNVGAGAGATVGKLAGRDRAMKSGVGTSAVALPNGLTVSALVVVNASGDIVDPASGKVIAGMRTPDGRGLADSRLFIHAGSPRTPAIGVSTTLGVVGTNARLTKVQATKVAQMAQDGLARAVAPVHTPDDGDTIFVLATGARNQTVDLLTVGSLAADVVSDAIVRAARAATSIPGYPAARDLAPTPKAK